MKGNVCRDMLTCRYSIILLPLLALLPVLRVAGQADSLVAPMDIPLLPSGNFMELRSDHFHSGVDLKTNGAHGVPVRAVKAGWVARIRVSPWGYGKAVYLQHNDGTTTVYGHLSAFNKAISAAALAEQYRLKEATIDYYPQAGALSVQKGEVIAQSGNTGGSSAPHLHLEVRRTSDQHALDPQAHGLALKDGIPPEIKGVRLYPLDANSRVGPYPGKAQGFPVNGANGSYRLREEHVVTASGAVGIAVHAIDRYDGSSNVCGVRKIEMRVDGVAAFSATLDELDFDLTRYVNAHMDYTRYKEHDMHYHRCYTLPNNKLGIYGKEAWRGRIELGEGIVRQVDIVITDAAGNKSTLGFTITGAASEEAAKWSGGANVASNKGAVLLQWDKEHSITKPGTRMVLPAGALYEDAILKYERRSAPPKAWSPVHAFMDPLIPLQASSTISITPDSVPKGMAGKLLLVGLDDQGRPTARGGAFANGEVSAKVKAFGAFTLMLDSVPPKLTPLDLKPDMRGRSSFSLKVADNLSGLDKWTATLDDNWILMEFDPKTKALTHIFDSHSESPGQRRFTLTASDERGNKSEYRYEFQR